jgi:cytochrome oxidase Cu insertion factor (SCO1/SenC/PrrC family)
MNPTSVSILIAAVGVIVSICSSVFVAGARWGRVEGDMRSMSDRLAKIEGMFTLKLRDGDRVDQRSDQGR